MTDSFVRLTNAVKSSEIDVDDPIHVNLHRVQALWVIKDTGNPRLGCTRIEMNVWDEKKNAPLTYYVKEKPGDILDQQNA